MFRALIVSLGYLWLYNQRHVPLNNFKPKFVAFLSPLIWHFPHFLYFVSRKLAKSAFFRNFVRKKFCFLAKTFWLATLRIIVFHIRSN